MFPPTAGAPRLLVSGTLTLMISRGLSVHQTSHQRRTHGGDDGRSGGHLRTTRLRGKE